jgi:hypothetical protein
LVKGERGRPLPDLPRVEVCGHLSSFSLDVLPPLSPPCAIINSSTLVLTTASASDVDMDVDASDLSYALCMHGIYILGGSSSSLPSILGRRATTLDVGEAFGPFYFYFPSRLRSLLTNGTVQRCRRQRKKTETETETFVCTMSESFSFPQVSTVYWSLPFLFFPPPDERSHTRIHTASFSAGVRWRRRSLLRVTYVREKQSYRRPWPREQANLVANYAQCYDSSFPFTGTEQCFDIYIR